MANYGMLIMGGCWEFVTLSILYEWVQILYIHIYKTSL